MPPSMDSILHICTRYLRGGSEARIRDMMSALPHVKHYLIVGIDSDAELARRQLPAHSVSVEPLLGREISPYRDIACLIRLRSAIRGLSPSMVVTHQSKAGALGRLAAWGKQVPVVHSLSMANFGPGYPRIQDLIFRIVERALAPITAAYLVVGQDLADRFAELGIPRRKLRVVRSGVRLSGTDTDIETLKGRIGEQWGVSPDIPWLVHVGALERRKNVELLPSLMNDIRETLGERAAHLFIVGEGQLRAEIEAAIEAADLAGSITLTGYAEEAIDYIRAAHVVVLLSSAEGMPQVLVQAAAVGIPFAAFEVDGLGELLHLGAEGIVVSPHDMATLLNVVVSYLARGKNPKLIDTSPWSAGTIERQYSDFFRDLTDFSLI